jgi:UDPglucose 6-dehydrogenase
MKVAIIGLGTVGKAQERLFAGHELVTYDPAYHDHYPNDLIARCAFAVVCVNTPAAPDGSADLTNFRAAMHQLPRGLPTLVRSTVPPGTIDGYNARLVAHSPEFLQERSGGAWHESADVPFMILGGRGFALAYFRPLLREVFPGRIHECSPLVAELVKYTSNLYWATRVTFVNEMAHVCAAFGADWELVRSAWMEDERVSPDYTCMAGFPPGFAGACWPKDLAALIAASDKAGYCPEFLTAVRDANARFREGELDG